MESPDQSTIAAPVNSGSGVKMRFLGLTNPLLLLQLILITLLLAHHIRAQEDVVNVSPDETMNVNELLSHTQLQQSSVDKSTPELTPSNVIADPYLHLPPYTPPDWHTNNRSAGMCAMQGTCWGDPLYRSINCPGNLPAQMPIGWNTSEYCPRFVGGPVCCNAIQYGNLTHHMGTASSVLQGCPACWESFKEFFCQYTCSPNQATFLTVENVLLVNQTRAPNGTIVDEVFAVNQTRYFVAEEYALKFYNSCRDVKSTADGSNIMQEFFGQSTNFQQFLEFLGKFGTSDESSPIQIDYTFTPLNDTLSLTSIDNIIPCNDSDSRYTCTCSNCRTCNGPQCIPHPLQPESELVFGGSFIDPLNAGLILGAFTYLGLLLAIWSIRAAKRRLPAQEPASRISRSIRCGHQFSTAFLILAALLLILFLVGLSWILIWGQTEIPTSDQTQNTIYFVDSYWSYWLFGTTLGIAGLIVLALIISCYFTSGLDSFRWTKLPSSSTTTRTTHSASIGDPADLDKGQGYMRRRVSDIDALQQSNRPFDSDEEFDDEAEHGPISPHGMDSPNPYPRRAKFGLSDRLFTFMGHIVATHPWKVILLAILVTGACAIGIKNIELETDPIKLWVPPDSEIFQDKQQFDDTFGAFYRTEQVIWFIDTNNVNYNPALFDGRRIDEITLLDPAILRTIYSIEQEIQALTAVYNNQTITWDSLCDRPTESGCVRMSITGYFDGSVTNNNPFKNASVAPSSVMWWIEHCIENVVFSACRSDIGAPMYPKVIFGGFDFEAQDYTNATALITTYLLHNEPEDLDPAMAWEQVYLDTVSALNQQFLDQGIPLMVHYSAERSVQDELARSSSADIPTIAISYGVMFVYISIALGRLWPIDRLFFVRTKCMLGFSAILLVLFSLTISVGLVCTMGVKMTPIISEVIPFLVLAIGIDNVFILLNTFERQDRSQYPSVEVRMKRTLREVGTSITLASFSEAVAFILGGQTKMPAVRAFAFYSCAAILADYFLQITAFTAIIVLDARRTEGDRVDCCPCMRVNKSTTDLPKGYSERLMGPKKPTDLEDEYEYDEEYKNGSVAKSTTAALPTTPSVLKSIVQENENGTSPPTSPNGNGDDLSFSLAHPHGRQPTNDGCLQRFMRDRYAPFLLNRVTKRCVIVSFVLLFIFMIGYGVHNLQLGLDHKYVVPKDSYLQDYFGDLQNVFAVGPPVYFVVNPSNITDFKYPENQNRICSQAGCSESSLSAIIFNHICDPSSLLAQGPSSWLDEYLNWLMTTAPCCQIDRHDQWCQFVWQTCTQCLDPSAVITYNNISRPPPEVFTQYMPWFLTKSKCSVKCGSCGWGHFEDVIWDAEANKTGATRFMAYHSPLRSEGDFINALKSGRAINQEIIDAQGFDAYVYSVVYPYFEQYLYIVDVCVLNTGLGMAGIFVLCMVLIRNFWASLLIVLTIIMILGDLLGVMALWNITLNALSVLNFVMAIGISVEFCIHLTVAFMHTRGTRDYRIGSSLVTVGSSIISGITLTKFSGVMVLAAATSEVFEIYYFRMYLAIVIFGCLHGLTFLPVLLSLVGPPSSLHRKKSWNTFFAFQDESGVDDDQFMASTTEPVDEVNGAYITKSITTTPKLTVAGSPHTPTTITNTPSSTTNNGTIRSSQQRPSVQTNDHYQPYAPFEN